MGNGAWNQHQHDVWGMLLDAVDVQFRQNAAQISMPLWEGLAGFVDAALEHWREPDQGLWEVRGEPKHFTASKVMCWVAALRRSGEVLQVAAGLLDVVGTVIGAVTFVAGDHRGWLQRTDGVDGGHLRVFGG